MKKIYESISFHMESNLKSRLTHIDVIRYFTDWNKIPKSKAITWDTITDPETI